MVFVLLFAQHTTLYATHSLSKLQCADALLSVLSRAAFSSKSPADGALLHFSSGPQAAVG